MGEEGSYRVGHESKIVCQSQVWHLCRTGCPGTQILDQGHKTSSAPTCKYSRARNQSRVGVLPPQSGVPKGRAEQDAIWDIMVHNKAVTGANHSHEYGV